MSAIQSMSKQTQIQIEFIRLFLFIYCIQEDYFSLFKHWYKAIH